MMSGVEKGKGLRLASIGRALALIVLVVVFALTPAIASAHAGFVSSEPEPGEELPNAPGVVVLRFSEPINLRLSRAAVIDPSGQRFEGVVTGEQQIQVRLFTNITGIYQVAWTTVSVVDGHTLHGTFKFGVRVPPGEGSEGRTLSMPQLSDLIIAIARAVEYAALLMAVGMLVLRRLASRKPELPWLKPRLCPVLGLALASGIAVILGEALAAAPVVSVDPVVIYLTTGLPGGARLLRLAALALALALSLSTARWEVVPLSAAIVGLAAAGHAAAVAPAWWGISSDALHLIAAGVWAGGILAMPTIRPPGGFRGPQGAALLERFSPVALPAFVITIGFGILRGIQELGSPGELLTSSYGQVLTMKGIAVLVMVPLSLRAWRRRLAAPRLEAALAILVVGAAALLAAYPLPPARISEAEAGRERPAQASALPQAGDLSLGGNGGEVLVGITIRPGKPGPNNILVYLLPVQGEAAASTLAAELTVNGSPVKTKPCAATCRSGEVTLQGGERLEVLVPGSKGGTASFQLPDLPAPEGDALLQRVQERMHLLKTFGIEEVLGPAQPPVRTVYAFQAPDRMRMEVSNGFQTVWVGGTRYIRDRPDEPWRDQSSGTTMEVPRFIWDAAGRPQFVAPRVLGVATLEGVQTQVLSFFEQVGPTPVWFHLWVDARGFVRRAEMRAQGHFMDQRYYDFDAPFTIEPPSG